MFQVKKKSLAGCAPQTLPQHHDLQIALFKHVSLGSTVGQIQQILEMIMNDVNRDGESQAREPMSDVNWETCRRQFCKISTARALPHESVVFDVVRC